MMKRYYLFFAILTAFAAATIASNIVLRRGPVHDATAAQDIRNIQSAVDSYYLTQNKLPENLRLLSLDGFDAAKRLSDYEYIRADADTYEICTTFQTARQISKQYYSPGPGGTEMPDPDNHVKGRQCFSYTVLPIQKDPYRP